MPYSFIGFNLGNIIVSGVCCAYIIAKKEIKVPKNLLTIIILFYSIYSIIQTVSTGNIDSYVGVCKYLGIILVYIVIYNLVDSYREEFISKFIYIIGSINIIYIIIQGIVYDSRINGLLGYSNTYALILLICLGLCKDISIKYKNYIIITLIIGIIYTGSRTTMLMMIGYQMVLFVEEKRDIKIILNLLYGITIYTLLECFLGLTVLFFPIIWIVLKKIYNYNLKKYQQYLILSVICVITLLFKTNSFVRILNISFNNGSLQERLVSFWDTINAVSSKPLGYGINSFYYKITEFKSSEYEIRFVHNSILDSSFELGIIGGILVSIILLLVIYKILKSKVKISTKLLGISIICHTMVDFDSAYLVFYISLFIYYFWNIDNDKIIYIKKSKVLVAGAMISILCIGYIEGIYIVSRFGTDIGEIDLSKKAINLSIVEDWRIINLKSDIEFMEYKKTGNKQNLENAKKYLEESLEINKNPITSENLKWVISELD